MRTIIVMGVVAFGVGAGGAILSVGCFQATCNDTATCPGTGSGTTTSSSSSSSSGGDSGPPPSCIPNKNTQAVGDSCGVFVSSSKGDDTTGKGTKELPYKTITTALSKAGSQPVYACDEAFTETVTLNAVAELYGALDCANGWSYNPSKKTQLTAAADAIPMTLTSTATGSAVYDFAITAADATKVGGSSIAVLDNGADVTLENVDVVAGNGVAGAAGAVQAQVMTPASAKGSDGTDDAACNVAGLIAGGPGGTNTCGGTATNGGVGGKGIADVIGGPGASGLPTGSVNGGAGQTATAACKQGQQGADGMPGAVGMGARGIGDLSTAGYAGAVAALGAPGGPGQGGGGGGGAFACDMPTNMFAGPSGGGGGAGGCGGAAGNLGQSGGSSIGILAISAKLTLTTVTVATRAGGAGGVGGNGQPGGAGGLSGHTVGANACDGGKGGQGGRGGSGGGGAGGHSVAIALKGGSLPDLTSTTTTLGTVGASGLGGDMDMTAGTKGDPGLACKTLDFTNPMSPTACAM